jgi:ABC-type amino acid transport substrate-binding protein
MRFQAHLPVLVLAITLSLGGCDRAPSGVPPATPSTSAAPSIEVRERFAPGAASAQQAPSFAEALASGEAELAFLFVPSSGFAYRGADGHLTGVTVELLRDFARHVADAHGLQISVRWIEEPLWADFFGYVRNSEGGVFGIGNVTITEEREAFLDFSPPYLQNIAVLVTHEDVPELGSMAEIGEAFSGLVALRYPGTLHEARLLALRDSDLPNLSFLEIASNDALVDGLAAGPESFGYIDIYNYWRAREAGRPLRRHPVGDDAAETFGIILPNDSDWTPVLAAYMASIGGARGETLSRLLGEHLGDELALLLSGS